MAANFCRECGAQLKPNAKFCSACGTPVYRQETTQAKPVQEPVLVQPDIPQPAQPEKMTIPGGEITFDIDSQMIGESTKQPDLAKLISGLAAAGLSFAAIWNANSPVLISVLLSAAAVAVSILIGKVRVRKK